MPAQPPLLDITARSSFIQPPVIDMWSDLARRLDQHSTNSVSKNVDGLFLEDLRKMCLEESTRTSPCSLFEPPLTSYRGTSSSSMNDGASSSSALPTSTTRLTSSQIQPNLLTLATSTNNSRLKTSPNPQPQQHQHHLQQQQVIEDTNQGLLWQQLAGLSLEDILPYNRLKTR